MHMSQIQKQEVFMKRTFRDGFRNTFCHEWSMFCATIEGFSKTLVLSRLRFYWPKDEAVEAIGPHRR